MSYPEGLHEIRRHLKLAAFLGAENNDETLEFPIRQSDETALASALDGREIAGPFVCIHPGARYLSRRWLPERFAAVADDLADDGYEIVLTGSADEAALAESVSRHMSCPHIDLAGRTSLGAAGALVARASLVITNDTGMSHLVAAVGVPSVVVGLGSDAARWAPLNRDRHRLVSVDVACRPCEYRVCPIHFPCAHELRSQTVTAAARELLNSCSGARSTTCEASGA
jgi:ADP-heptose:LPS heptosyltransferase